MLVKHHYYIDCKVKRKLGKTINTLPTIGSNYETIKVGNVTLQTHDLGGQDSLRKVWKNFYPGTSGIIFVIDSTNDSQFDTIKSEID